jgi:hypothetical protein
MHRVVSASLTPLFPSSPLPLRVCRQIKERTGASVTVRGRYVPKGSAPPAGDRPLYLNVMALDEKSVADAVRLIDDLSKLPGPVPQPTTIPPATAATAGAPTASSTGTATPASAAAAAAAAAMPPPPPPGWRPPVPGFAPPPGPPPPPSYVSAPYYAPPPPPSTPTFPAIQPMTFGSELKVYVGMAAAEADPNFGLIDKLTGGPDAPWLKHIDTMAKTTPPHSVQIHGYGTASRSMWTLFPIRRCALR